VVPLLAMVVALPTLWLPFILDDWFHLLALDGWLSGDPVHPYFAGWVDAYGLPNVFRFFEPGRGEEFMPWWSDPELSIRFWRPLSSLDALFDRLVFGDNAMRWHAHSVFWYGLLVAAACSVFRVGLGRAALVPALLYAIDETHFLPVAWLANRNALIAGALALFGLGAHLRWREEGSSAHGVLSLSMLGLGLLGGEAALGVFGYIGAYELNRWRKEGPSAHLLPALGLGLAWAVHYKHHGFGSVGSGNYLDPTHQPIEYLSEVTVRLPMLIEAQFLGIPSDLGLFFSPSIVPLTLLGLAVMAVLAVSWRWLFPQFEEDERTTLTWMLPGAVLSMFPVMATFPIDRLLLIPGLGFSVLTAAILRVAWRRKTWWVLGPGALMHVLVPLVMWFAGVAFYGSMSAEASRIVRSTELPPELAEKKALVLVSSDPAVSIYLPMELRYEGRRLPDVWQILSMVKADHRLLGTEDGWRLEALSGRMLTQVFELLFRNPSREFTVGQRTENLGLNVTVAALSEGTPTAIDFSLDTPEDWVWLSWTEQGLVEIQPPAAGQTLELPWAPGPMGI
jgi:hypothetical protein